MAVDLDNNCDRAAKAVLLAIEIVARELDPDDPISRDHMVSMSKLVAKVALEESKVLLCWLLDTRNLLVILPKEKFLAWSKMIKDIIERETSRFDELDSLIGRLVHVSVIIPYMKHFLSRIRQEKKRSKNRKKIKLCSEAVEDLSLHLDFLSLAKEGISMNLLSYRMPTHVYRGMHAPLDLAAILTRVELGGGTSQ